MQNWSCSVAVACLNFVTCVVLVFLLLNIRCVSLRPAFVYAPMHSANDMDWDTLLAGAFQSMSALGKLVCLEQ